MKDQKWVCNKCGYEIREKPKHRNSTCESCGKGRFRKWTLCECGKWFHGDSSTRQFCSAECTYEYRRTGGKKGKHYPHLQRARIATCPVCGKEFRAVKDTVNKPSVYCSKECWSKRSSEDRTCEICGRVFRSGKSAGRKYCSLGCRNLAYRERTGELSNFWQGGRTKEIDLLRTSADYRDWRMAVFKRDEFKCQRCGKTGNDLEAHHIMEKSNYPALMFDLNNGLTLCHECHKKTDNYGRKAKLIQEEKQDGDRNE